VHNQRTDPHGDVLQHVIEQCQAQGVSAQVLGMQGKDLPVTPAGLPDAMPQAVIVLGGDGTFLHAARLFAPHRVPLLGINTGSLGFLTRVNRQQLQQALDHLLQEAFTLEERLMLSVSIDRSTVGLALNDVVVKNANPSQLAALHVALDEKPLANMDADGLIVATPTGSTAYTLAAGGPILAPDMAALALTPICPHSLSLKPLVIPSCHRLRVEAMAKNFERASRIQVSIDGQSLGELDEGQTLEIVAADNPLLMVLLNDDPSQDFYHLIRQKLHWGYNPRQQSS
jgi:NAD+ kinase